MKNREIRLQNLIKKHNFTQKIDLTIDGLTTKIFSGNTVKTYNPAKSLVKAHENEEFIRLIMGPYGSGKSTWCVNEIVRRACQMPEWSNGRKRSRWAIVRNTSGELQSTTLQTWLQWFSDLGDIYTRQKPILTYIHTFNDGQGIVELELIFLALDREDDLRKVKSLELTGVYLNELSEIPQNALSHFKGRVNHRYPSKSFCKDYYWSGIIADTNPPDVDHWIYKTFEINKPQSYRIYHQPPGLIKDADNNWIRNPDADNAENMSNDYYTKLAEGQLEGFVKVYCLGEYGSVGTSKVVYPEYNDDLHSRDSLEAIQGEPIHLGWDFGLNPSCVVVQFTQDGRILVLKEYTSEDIGIKTFAESIVLPSLQRDFPYCKIGISKADPSGGKKDEIMEELSCIGVLCGLGIDTMAAKSNIIDTRLYAVRFFLSRLINKTPSLLLDRKRAPILRKGFIKDYAYKRVAIAGEERYKNEPNKNYASHVHDALQYILLDFASSQIIKEKAPKETVNMWNPTLRIF